MKKSKKIISLLLAVAIVISVLATALIVTATEKKATVSISVAKTELSAGESTTVSVTVVTDFPVATMSIPVFYDKELVSVSDAVAVLDGYSVKNAIVDSESADVDRVFANTGMDQEKYGFVLVNYIGGAGAEVPESINGVALTFNVTAKNSASGTAIVKCLGESAKTEENIEGMLYFGATVSGRAINEIPENVENVDVTNALSEIEIMNAAPKLVPLEGTGGVVDNENYYIYGIEAGSNIENLFAVENGKINLVENENGVTNGTGATVQVLDGGNEVIATYTVIVFGDVNGDGEIDNLDYGLVKESTQGVALGDYSLVFAADVSGDGEIDNLDYGLIKNSTQGTSLTTNPYI